MDLKCWEVYYIEDPDTMRTTRHIITDDLCSKLLQGFARRFTSVYLPREEDTVNALVDAGQKIEEPPNGVVWNFGTGTPNVIDG